MATSLARCVEGSQNFLEINLSAWHRQQIVVTAKDKRRLVSNDTDCVPALKYGRRSGLQVVIIELPNCNVAPELVIHSDFKRPVLWP